MAMGSEQLIANELLAFLQHAIDTMDEVSIMQICKTNFTQEEICSGKELLYKSLNKIDRMPSRRRDEKGEKSLQDIICLLKGTDPDDVPTFVARNLNKLPPVTFDHVDVTRLLKDITTVKASLADVQLKLEVSQNTISELRAEVITLRNTISASRSPENANVNTKRGTCNVSGASFASAKMQSLSSPCADPETPCTARPAPPPAEAPISVNTSTPQRAYAAVAARQPPVPRPPKRKERGSLRTEPPRSVVPLAPVTSEPDKEGFIKVERKKKKPPCRNRTGTAPTGPNNILRPAVPATYVYVSRLHYTTTCKDVVEYLAAKTTYRLRVEQLESHNKVNFSSFVVRVPTEMESTFLKEDLWPKGVVFRKYRGRRRPPPVKLDPCHTSPISKRA